MAKKEKFNYLNKFRSFTQKAIEESEILIDIFENFDGAENMLDDMQKAHEIEHAGDDINHEIFRQVAADFITPIDREDILSLAGNLDNVLDTIEVAIQHVYMYDIHSVHEDAIEFAKLVNQACIALDECIETLYKLKIGSGKLREKIVKVNEVEEAADILYMDVIRKLYTQDHDKPVKIMAWSRIFHNMEDVCDACEHVTDVVMSVLLKNS